MFESILPLSRHLQVNCSGVQAGQYGDVHLEQGQLADESGMLAGRQKGPQPGQVRLLTGLHQNVARRLRMRLVALSRCQAGREDSRPLRRVIWVPGTKPITSRPGVTSPGTLRGISTSFDMHCEVRTLCNQRLWRCCMCMVHAAPMPLQRPPCNAWPAVENAASPSWSAGR